MAYEFRTRRLVEFAETDMAGIMHFSNFYKYMESAEHLFFRSLGLRVHGGTKPGAWGAARRRAECSFQQPLRYMDEVELHLLVREKRSRSISYEVVFYKLAPEGAADGAAAGAGERAATEVARGAMTVVFVTNVPGEGALRAMAIPPEVDALVDVAPG